MPKCAICGTDASGPRCPGCGAPQPGDWSAAPAAPAPPPPPVEAPAPVEQVQQPVAPWPIPPQPVHPNVQPFGLPPANVYRPAGPQQTSPAKAGIAFGVAVAAVAFTVWWRDRILEIDLSAKPFYAIMLAGYGTVVVAGLLVPWLARRSRRLWLVLLSIPAIGLAALSAVGFYNNLDEYRRLSRLADRFAAEAKPTPTFTAKPVPKNAVYRTPEQMLAVARRGGFACDTSEKSSADNTGAITLACTHAGEVVFLEVYPTAAVQKEHTLGESVIRQGKGWGISADTAKTADALFAILKRG